MAQTWAPPGLANVGSYQVAGQPYISGSTSLAAGVEWNCSFPYVTKSITVINHANQTLRVHFNSTGSSANVVDRTHFVELDSDEDSYTFNAKCNKIYVSAPSGNSSPGSFRVVAELTGIEAGRMYDLTGSGLTE